MNRGLGRRRGTYIKCHLVSRSVDKNLHGGRRRGDVRDGGGRKKDDKGEVVRGKREKETEGGSVDIYTS